MNTTTDNVFPFQPTPPRAPSTPDTPPGYRRFSPERWLLLGSSPGWLQAAEQWVKQRKTDPGVLGWRVRHGLLQVQTPQTLAPALASALAAEPAALFVLAERAAFQAPNPSVDDLIARAWPADAVDLGDEEADPVDQAAVYVQLLGADFSGLAQRLSQPDSVAAEYWLLSGRSVWPHIALPQPDAAFEADAQQAFQHWAGDYLDSHDPRDLDAIYGTAETFAQRMATPWKDEEELDEQPEDDAPTQPSTAVAGTLAARLGGRLTPQAVAAQSLAAAAAGTGTATGRAITGVFDRSDSTGPVDRYRLQLPGAIPVGGKRALTVELELATARWKDHPRLVLEIHTDGMPVQLLRWSLEDRAPGSRPSTFMLTQQMDCTEPLRLALNRGVEMWLTAAAD